MKTAELKADIRKSTGGKSAKMSRKNDKVPAVVYGAGGNKHVEVEYLPLVKLVQSEDLFLINLNTGEDSTRVIVQDTQYHPVTDRLLHVDFLEAAVGKKANLDIPIEIIGKSIGVMNGGMLVVKMRRLKVRGVPADMPERIEIDISDLDIGRSIKVGDIEGLEKLDSENAVIVRVKAARKVEEIVPELDEEAVEGEEGEEGAETTAEGEAPAEGSAEAPTTEKAE